MQRRVADAAPRRVEDAAERHLVPGIGDGAEVREHVSNLTPVEKARPADHRVGDPTIGQRSLEGAALGVGPVEDCDLAEADALVPVERGDLARHERCLVAVVAGAVAPDPVTLAERAPQVLLLTEQVVAYNGVGGIEDRLAGPVVLIEHDHPGVGERPLELEQVAHLGTPEPVDALVGVADDTDVASGLPELYHQLVLREVRVLVLVHEDVLESLLVVLEHVGMLAEHPHGANQQVVEVHRVRRHETPLVLGVSLGDPPLVDRPGALVESRHVDHVRLGRADDTQHGSRREAPLVDAEVVEDVLHEPAAVAVVVDAETRPVADPLRVAAQHPDTRGMERGHPHLLGVCADKLHDSAAHLVRGLVGEGDREYPPRRHTRDDKAGDAASKDAGLA